MTMDEAKDRAKNMGKINMLNELKQHLNRDWDQLDIIYTNGTRTGIGNTKALEAAKEALLKELQRQIDEECWL